VGRADFVGAAHPTRIFRLTVSPPRSLTRRDLLGSTFDRSFGHAGTTLRSASREPTVRFCSQLIGWEWSFDISDLLAPVEVRAGANG
jgi:hypothetical protein